MLADIAKELSGEVVFPTYFDAVLRLRRLLQRSGAEHCQHCPCRIG
jgi:hypothetical protein